MPLRTDAGKALRQIERRDPQGAQQYRAELKYFHVPQRVILGFTNAYAVLDETHDWGQLSGAEAAERFRRGFANAPTLADYGLSPSTDIPTPEPTPHTPHALPPT